MKITRHFLISASIAALIAPSLSAADSAEYMGRELENDFYSRIESGRFEVRKQLVK